MSLINRIVGRGYNKKAICAIGTYQGSHIAGQRAAPNKVWRKRLATIPGVSIVDVNEYFTSMKCSECRG